MGRGLDDKTKTDIKQYLEKINVSNIVLRFEYGGEAVEFSQKIIVFLTQVGFNVYSPVDRTQSGIRRGDYLEIEKHPSDSDCAIITFGSIY